MIARVSPDATKVDEVGRLKKAEPVSSPANSTVKGGIGGLVLS